MAVTPEQAMRTYPELRQLAQLRSDGWTFLSLQERPDDPGPSGIVGYRQRGDFVDVLYVFGRTEARAARLLDDTPGARGGLVWERAGALADTVAALLELPAPGEPGAPRLLIARPS